MGWFSSSNDAPTQQFGAPSTFGASAMGMGGGMMMNNGMTGQMDPMAMQQMRSGLTQIHKQLLREMPISYIHLQQRIHLKHGI